MAPRLPKSVPESQKYMTWAFPVLIGFGAANFIGADIHGVIALSIGVLVVITGWSSFAIIREADYNDLLLVCDIALVISYVLYLYYAGQLGGPLGPADVGIWSVSSAIFGFYAVWDFSALLARDTRALATRLHLRRFGFIGIAMAIPFAAGAILVSYLAADDSSKSIAARVPFFAFWIGILVWWHYGRVVAAIRDGKEGE